MSIIFDESNEVYHANPAYSSTEGKLALEDIAKLGDYRAGIIEKSPDARHFVLGSAVHCALLEPHAFAQRYAIKPDGLNLSTKEGRAWKTENEGREHLSHDEHRAIGLMRERLCPAIRSILDDSEGRPEVTIRIDDEGLPLQCRLDWWRRGPHAIHDLKTTTRFSSFARAAHDLGYAFSVAWYCYVYHHELGVWPTFDFLVVEAVPPFRSAIFTPTDAFLAYGRKQVNDLLPRLRAAHLKGEFRSDCPQHLDLDLPGFVRTDDLDDEAGFLL